MAHFWKAVLFVFVFNVMKYVDVNYLISICKYVITHMYEAVNVFVSMFFTICKLCFILYCMK